MKTLLTALIVLISMAYFSSAQQSECDYKVEIVADGDEFEKEDFKWRMKAAKLEGKSTNITGRAKIEADGKTIKEYKPWTSQSISKQKTSSEYSPNLKEGTYEITTEISVECEDTNKGNNMDTKTIRIKGEGRKDSNEENEEEPNSDKERQNIVEPTANLEGINSKDKKQIQSKNLTTKKSAIKTKESSDNTVRSTKGASQQLQPTAQAISPQIVVYESSSGKARNLILILLLVLSILLNIILIWRR